ncbi:hypothetical protein BDK63_000384 [Halomonas campaniensis]|uniref:Uncharacterized protein n=1 Tax=Halomonas campaniensis TaxID=213554 RepID=A0A7W5K085_9GAMM|nr:hypothetical protein [Halomonas campaniensis]MBB3329544.1 hypothetical protein [Halomonas campaniensis]
MDNPDWDQQERKEQAEALLEMLRLGEESRATGKSMTAEEFIARLEARHEARRGESS